MKATIEPDGSVIVERSQPVKENCTCAVRIEMENMTGIARLVANFPCARYPKCNFPIYTALEMAQLIFDHEETVTAHGCSQRPAD